MLATATGEGGDSLRTVSSDPDEPARERGKEGKRGGKRGVFAGFCAPRLLTWVQLEIHMITQSDTPTILN